MNLLTGLAIFCLVYAVVMFFSAFAKIPVMIKLVKMKFGKDSSDKKAIKILYITGVCMLIASIILFVVK